MNSNLQDFGMLKYQDAVAQAHTSPKDSEGNPVNTSGNGPPPLDSTDCEWAEWGPCNDNVECGIGTQVIK